MEAPATVDLSTEAIHDIIHPTAAFSFENLEVPSSAPDGDLQQGREQPSWLDSPLNPKNRANSLELPESPMWRVDGCTGLGTQFYLVPLFLERAPPFRVDAFIPPQTDHSRYIRDVLDLDIAFHTKDGRRVQQLGISRHIVRKLQSWTRIHPDPAAWYTSLRFGSRIVFRNLSLHLEQIDIEVADTWYVERQLLSTATLASMWGEQLALPPTVDISEVHVLEQLHDSVCVARIQSELFILKALTSYTKYLYHELRNLLTLDPHPNLLARPCHLVTKLCTFGPSTKVIGFTVPLHPHGTMRDIVPFLRLHGSLSLSDQLKWSIQLASAMQHLRRTTKIYYPDLRLDNIVLSDALDVIMIDFEQRGVWAEFGPPEINSIEYMRLLATDEGIPEDIQDRYTAILKRLLPDYLGLMNKEAYSNPPGGYNIPWLCLTPREQEAAEVYMLGRVLWCLFEGLHAPHRTAVWLSYRWESDLEFPNFRHTPPAIRELIDRCTRGRRPVLSNYIFRKGATLVLRRKQAKDTLAEAPATTGRDIRQVAREWWRAEIKVAERFLDMREQMMAEGQWHGNYFERPSMEEVLDTLLAYQKAALG